MCVVCAPLLWLSFSSLAPLLLPAALLRAALLPPLLFLFANWLFLDSFVPSFFHSFNLPHIRLPHPLQGEVEVREWMAEAPAKDATDKQVDDKVGDARSAGSPKPSLSKVLSTVFASKKVPAGFKEKRLTTM